MDDGPAVDDGPLWRRPDTGPSLHARTVIHIDDAHRAVGPADAPYAIVPLTGPDCDLSVITFTFPANFVGTRHWHPADTFYLIRRGEFVVAGEGSYREGDVRWVKAGSVYGPEGAGPEGCEVVLIAPGAFPLPIHDPDVTPPPSSVPEWGEAQPSRETRNRPRSGIDHR